ncbi:hypothetical protein BGY98DRAFT_960854, partial [Russula aff. rugulosa BPL654]
MDRIPDRVAASKGARKNRTTELKRARLSSCPTSVKRKASSAAGTCTSGESGKDMGRMLQLMLVGESAARFAREWGVGVV